MTFTMEDFNRQYIKEHFKKLTPEERREALESLPPEELQQIRDYLNRVANERTASTRKSRRKK